jgi:hypothetical protein
MVRMTNGKRRMRVEVFVGTKSPKPLNVEVERETRSKTAHKDLSRLAGVHRYCQGGLFALVSSSGHQKDMY